MFLMAKEKEGNAAAGSLGEGEATVPFLGTLNFVGLSINHCFSCLRSWGDQTEPSLFPNIMGNPSDFIATGSGRADAGLADARPSSSETDCQNAWLRVLSAEFASGPSRGS